MSYQYEKQMRHDQGDRIFIIIIFFNVLPIVPADFLGGV